MILTIFHSKCLSSHRQTVLRSESGRAGGRLEKMHGTFLKFAKCRVELYCISRKKRPSIEDARGLSGGRSQTVPVRAKSVTVSGGRTSREDARRFLKIFLSVGRSAPWSARALSRAGGRL